MTGLFFHEILRRWPNYPAIDPNGYTIQQSQIIHLLDGGRQKEDNNQIMQLLSVIINPLSIFLVISTSIGSIELANSLNSSARSLT